METQRITLGYEPQAVLAYFEKLCTIPHGSGNERAVAEFIEQTARSRGLFCIRDAKNNVFVRIPASEGREGEAAYLLQGHTDMVCASLSSSKHDFEHDPLDLYLDNGWLRARGTTLGGDDGIAVAMMLALIDGASNDHPTLELLFTVEEETGLFGAESFDYSSVTATRMINLDSESEDEICAGCAGGVRSRVHFAPTTEMASGDELTLTLDGLAGGHSGAEINCGRTNAVILTVRILRELAKRQHISLVSLCGGEKDNAIPRSCTARVIVEDAGDALELLESLEGEIRGELCEADSGLDFCFDVCCGVKDVETIAETENLISLVENIPVGVLKMSEELEGLVEFSRNLGVAEINTESVRITYSSRSAKEAQIDLSVEQIESEAGRIGATVSHTGRYPGWDFLPESELRELYAEKCLEITGKKPRTVVIHAGLECGIIKSRLPEMDIISVGPNMRNIHTPDEALDLASCERLFKTLLAVLRG